MWTCEAAMDTVERIVVAGICFAAPGSCGVWISDERMRCVLVEKMGRWANL